ncbi:hypothetical protein [Bradyrhizobium liaoningense]|uniref:hypothetical protein n=1 Tax=Bradyrhizobium liaoningense TaxID=43992 RepID=UPI001BA57469|nr:hypothetical protein [Bradyrhizobium liaoningense]MBR1033702.1 hypothetical protein [Bradyrhizobium liaoningense]
MVDFLRVKAILENAVVAWEARTGRTANLFLHGGSFGWATREELLSSTARGIQLISPKDIGTSTGAQSNLVKALTTGVAGFPRMPRGGPFVPDIEIDEIAEWLDGGAP